MQQISCKNQDQNQQTRLSISALNDHQAPQYQAVTYLTQKFDSSPTLDSMHGQVDSNQQTGSNSSKQVDIRETQDHLQSIIAELQKNLAKKVKQQELLNKKYKKLKQLYNTRNKQLKQLQGKKQPCRCEQLAREVLRLRQFNADLLEDRTVLQDLSSEKQSQIASFKKSKILLEQQLNGAIENQQNSYLELIHQLSALADKQFSQNKLPQFKNMSRILQKSSLRLKSLRQKSGIKCENNKSLSLQIMLKNFERKSIGPKDPLVVYYLRQSCPTGPFNDQKEEEGPQSLLKEILSSQPIQIHRSTVSFANGDIHPSSEYSQIYKQHFQDLKVYNQGNNH